MFRQIARDEGGVSAPEYAILLLLLVASLIVAVGALNDATTGVFNNTANGISEANGAGGSRSVASSGGTDTGSSSSSVTSSSSSGSTPPNSTGSNWPPSSNRGGHGKAASAPGQEKNAADSANAKPFAPGQTK